LSGNNRNRILKLLYQPAVTIYCLKPKAGAIRTSVHARYSSGQP